MTDIYHFQSHCCLSLDFQFWLAHLDDWPKCQEKEQEENPVQYIHLKGVTKINGWDAYQGHVNNSLRAHGRCIIDQGAISCGDKYFKGGWERKKEPSLVNRPRSGVLNRRLVYESFQLYSDFLWMPVCCADRTQRWWTWLPWWRSTGWNTQRPAGSVPSRPIDQLCHPKGQTLGNWLGNRRGFL